MRKLMRENMESKEIEAGKWKKKEGKEGDIIEEIEHILKMGIGNE